MKIIIGTGMYSPVRAVYLQNANMKAFEDALIDSAMALSFVHTIGYSPDKSNITVEQFIAENRTEDVPVIEVDRDLINANIFGLPGYIYMESSLSQLRRMTHKDIVYLEMDEIHAQPDGTRHRICAIIYPRYLGYSIEIPEELGTEEMEAFLTMQCRWLFLVPGTAPHQIELAPGIINYGHDSVKYTSYPLPNPGNPKPENTPDS